MDKVFSEQEEQYPRAMKYADTIPRDTFCQTYLWDGPSTHPKVPRPYTRPLVRIPRIEEPKAAFSDHIVTLIRKDLIRKWRVAEVARALHVSPRTLQRRLSDEGCSFARLVLKTRIDEAARLLKGSDLSLGEIGYLVGFADDAHFCREFKKMTGLTPMGCRFGNEYGKNRINER